jgi:hypothetical protein
MAEFSLTFIHPNFIKKLFNLCGTSSLVPNISQNSEFLLVTVCGQLNNLIINVVCQTLKKSYS